MNTLPHEAAERIKADEVQMDHPEEKISYSQSRRSQNGDAKQFVYPAALAAMTGAPTLETLQQGLDLEAQENETPLLAALRREWRLLLCCVPYFLLA